jgi:plastocyanin
MKGKFLMIAAVLVASLAACGGGGADNTTGTGNGNGNGNGTGTGTGGCTAGDGTICVQGTSFSPVDITISKNGTATWTEVVGVHHIVFDGPPPGATAIADIGDFSQGSVNRTFVTAGTYPYHCTIHGGVGTGMHGTVVVQ